MAERSRTTQGTPGSRFKPYPAYTDSGVEWLGETPAHWALTKMWDVTEATSGATPAKETLRYWDGGIPWVSPKDMKRRFIDGSEDTVSEAAVTEARLKLVPDPVVLVVVRGMILAHSFPVGITKVPVTINQDMKALRLRKEIEPHFFAWWLEGVGHDLLAVLVEEAAHGTKAIRMDRWRVTPVAIPPEYEQRAIVAFLDQEVARVDALVAKKERLIELLQEKRTALITRAVTKGLGPNVPMKDSGVEWLGEIPAHWDATKIKRLFRQTKRQGHVERTVLSVYRDYGVIEKSSREDNFNRTPEDLNSYQLVNAGDLVINKMKAWQGSLGVSPLSGITSPDYVVYSPHHSESGRFLHHFLRNRLLANVYLTMSNGIRPSQWRLEPERFEDLTVFIPPPAEQVQIVGFLDQETAKIDALMAKVHDAIDRLKELRTALISAAVTGKIDVREESVA